MIMNDMKNIFLSIKTLFLSLVCLSSTMVLASNENTLYIVSAEVQAGATEVEIPVYLTNEISICNLQVDIQLPEGFSIPYNNVDEMYSIYKGGRAKVKHNLDCKVQPDGSYRVMLSSPSNVDFYDTDAKKGLPVFVLYVDVDGNKRAGDCEVLLKRMVLNHYDSETKQISRYTPEDVACILTVLSSKVALPGDANGDSRVSIADVTTLVDYLTTGNTTNVDMDGADADGSGSVGAEDVEATVNILLEK